MTIATFSDDNGSGDDTATENGNGGENGSDDDNSSCGYNGSDDDNAMVTTMAVMMTMQW